MTIKLTNPVFVPPPLFGGKVTLGGPGISVF